MTRPLQAVYFLLALTVISDLVSLDLLRQSWYGTNNLALAQTETVFGVFVAVMAVLSMGVLLRGKVGDHKLRQAWTLVLAAALVPLVCFFLAACWSIAHNPFELGTSEL